jgi:phosphate starvation-inducible PhoH-like protein
MDIYEKKITINSETIQSLIGPGDALLDIIEARFQSTIYVRGNILTVKGSQTELKIIENVFNELQYIINKNKVLEEDDVLTVLELLATNNNKNVRNGKLKMPKDNVIYWGFKDAVRARNQKQLQYYRKVLENDIVFAIGPAGTGKTYLAVAMALAELKKSNVSKIILSRPAVEAGESLGYLPGDLKEKLDPYLRPLLDALFIMLGPDKLKNLMEKNIIEIIPLAYMRGRTLANSFIILDEAQNATITQMKMFLTRMGEKSKVIVAGDVTQIDLPRKGFSGLMNANEILQEIKGISFVYFDEKDVVRHKLVTDIIKAYESDEEFRQEQKKKDIK